MRLKLRRCEEDKCTKNENDKDRNIDILRKGKVHSNACVTGKLRKLMHTRMTSNM